ncbi:unnamed protein product [Adineta steineri]|uniref:Uncharacterized protein n=1 Tax=Adineta steineri TaxID=433720 RepID=A0A819PEZ2_9BILA|nr:unnamed protein product [Adineta steineri]
MVTNIYMSKPYKILSEDVTNQQTVIKASMYKLFFICLRSHLRSYRGCDQVWTLLFDSLTSTSNTDSSWKINLTD